MHTHTPLPDFADRTRIRNHRSLLACACAGVFALVVGCANSTELSSANGRTTIKLASFAGSSFLVVTAGIEQLR
ncbi:NitT/TauT family transport system substrate-binding protein [Rhodococcus jostii]|uniref:NitT/TauT family transport system substrate-binding protein n=1 Tax=Rhodococcus jostii TaxID=132919 RepID=A0A1H5H5P0_RHOJO|nr:NitT/TauT family transport system substrate-binding protein [Rhodococcus jostii]